jgi:hypothetical protein
MPIVPTDRKPRPMSMFVRLVSFVSRMLKMATGAEAISVVPVRAHQRPRRNPKG